MRILVVEDEPTLCNSLRAALESRGFVVETAPDGEEAAFLGSTEEYDAVVLDLGLPRLDGISVLRAWRAEGRNFPVLILTARGGWSEKVAGFEAGADDFLAKPFEMEEVIYRLRALIRRTAGHGATLIDVGPLRFDTVSTRAYVNSAPLDLTAQELRILEYMVTHRGRTLSRTEITEHVYDRDFDLDSNVIDVLVGRLRKKIGAPLIHTVRGVGYRLSESPDA
ncbi:response regulator transcription factor [Phaeovibrio sulfidiphilus]|uniref:Response regulator transcription factor n=1 Tax=Phaeovibrio sulfidiphilus TaxID=1220600 RepID=A0A8J6YL79_9PROT|nr:response regulator transcription factor [Phaeovibrio sulfidiphilus]